MVGNAAQTTPAGLNAALSAAEGEIIVRRMHMAGFEHTSRHRSGAEEEEQAHGVGGWIEVDANRQWGRSIAAALGSRFGIGNARSWRRPRRDQGRIDVETFPLGCWPVEALRAAGGWDERFLRNQDYELNHRLLPTAVGSSSTPPCRRAPGPGSHSAPWPASTGTMDASKR